MNRERLYFFEDASACYVDVWHVAEFVLRTCDDVLKIGPIGGIAFEKVNSLGSLVRFVDKGFSLGRKRNVSDDNFAGFG